MPIDPALRAQTRRLERRQHAAASWEQLRAAGWSRSQIATRVDRGDWQRPFPRVYILGDPAVIPLAMESAVLLSLGEDAFLSHRTSGFLWGQAHAKPRLIDVTVVRAALRPRPGVRSHLTQSLDPKDIRHRDGLRVTSRRRDQILVAAGYTVIRITWHQLTNEPYKVVAAIAQALASARPHPAAA